MVISRSKDMSTELKDEIMVFLTGLGFDRSDESNGKENMVLETFSQVDCKDLKKDDGIGSKLGDLGSFKLFK